jgi:hypothetical protein
MYIYDRISLNSSQDKKHFGQNFLDEIKMHFIFNNFSENRVIYEIMWKNYVQPDRPQTTIYE